MPIKNRNRTQERQFKEDKKNALLGLLDALDEKTVPERHRWTFYSGQIAEFFDDRFLPLRQFSLRAVLREAGVPHDKKTDSCAGRSTSTGNNWMIYSGSTWGCLFCR